jgi:hypothetical protein
MMLIILNKKILKIPGDLQADIFSHMYPSFAQHVA